MIHVKHQLYIGSTPSGIFIAPDATIPQMWRVIRGDRCSDMVNLSRAKDAALGWLAQQRGKGLGPGEGVNWKPATAKAAATHRAKHLPASKHPKL